MRVVRLADAPVKKRVTGIDTYWRDFENIVMSELTKDMFFTRSDAIKKDAILAFHYLQAPLYEVENSKVIIYQILHNDIKSQHISWKRHYKNHRFVTHYSWFWKWLCEEKVKAMFIPMSVDTENLPYRDKRNGKIICFTNIWREKEEVYNRMREEGVEFDVLSMGKFNDSLKVHTQEECFEIVSEYEYGIGVGRSAIEMLAMGLKVVVAGKKYGGPINSSDAITRHWAINFNSVYSNSSGNVRDDFKDLMIVKKEDRKIFDMRTYLKYYKKFFEVS